MTYECYVILTYPAVQEHCGSTIICPSCELSRCAVLDACIFVQVSFSLCFDVFSFTTHAER